MMPAPVFRRKRPVIVVITLAFVLLETGRIVGSTGDKIQLPSNLTLAKNGLVMDIDPTWVNSNGYRPVRIAISNWPPVPATADRTLDVVMKFKDWSDWEFSWDLKVSACVEIPQGSVRGETVLLVPQDQAWNEFAMETREDGKQLKELSSDQLHLAMTGMDSQNEGFPAVLVIDRDVPTWTDRRARIAAGNAATQPSRRIPDIRGFARYLPVADPSTLPSGPGDHQVLSALMALPRMEMLPLSDVPHRWIDLTCFDLTFISFSDLQIFVRDYPDAWHALSSWTASGPTLCVYGVGEHYELLAELEEFLEMGSANVAEDAGSLYRGWSLPSAKSFHRENTIIAKLHEAYQQMNAPSPVDVADDMPNDAAGGDQPSPQGVPDPLPFVYRDFVMGRVVAFGPDEIFPGDDLQWNGLLNTVSPRRWMWYQRHGVSWSRENRDYWQFLIPGVGLAPVNMFRVLISLFVVVIGPVNYFLLRRRRRLHLLLVTIPAGAALVTVGLFGWALVSDGLGLRMRARSFTQIDQRNDRVVSWSRQSYFAGLPPSKGLSFPDDSAVYAVEPVPTLGNNRRKRVLEWDGDRQNLRSGYLQSRVTAQFMVGHSRRSTAGLEIVAGPERKSPPRVTNGMQSRIEQLILCDRAAQHYWAEGIQRGAEFVPHPVDPQVALDRIRKTVNFRRPQVPPGFDDSAYQGAMMLNRSYAYYDWGDGSEIIPMPSMRYSLLEANLQKAVGRRVVQLDPNSYVAIVESSSEMVSGTTGVREESSLHVVKGFW